LRRRKPLQQRATGDDFTHQQKLIAFALPLRLDLLLLRRHEAKCLPAFEQPTPHLTAYPAEDFCLTDACLADWAVVFVLRQPSQKL